MREIVVVDKKWGIGKNNDLLFSLPEDMAFFRKETTGKIVVMGSNTLKSLPGGKPLKNRTNIVLWPGGEKREDCIVCDSLDEIFEVLKNYPSDDIYVMGGAMFYKTMLPYCDTAFITKVDSDGEAQVFFENLDEHEDWYCDKIGEPIQSTSGYTIRFCTYKNKNVLK
ncbi:MAG: dihydrofolate reductase [Clostridia bacterium]|nr:dihydrofolate reductase [Clostridia bacterium]